MRDGRMVGAVVASLALLACGPVRDANPPPAARAVLARAQKVDEERARAAAFVAALEDDGFTVGEGYATIADPPESVDAHVIDSAAGFNYPQYYKRFVVPAHPAHGGGLDPDAAFFMLGEDEAIVFVGRTPPRADYFSFCPMVWARFPNTSGACRGDWVLASVRDPLNHLGIRTEGNGNPFHKSTIVVFTADQGVHDRIARSARRAGYPSSIVNSYPLPRADLEMGIAPGESDLLGIFERTANFTSAAEGDDYLHDDTWGRVYRVTPKTAREARPFPTPPWRDRTFTREADLVPGLEQGLERLRQAILARTAATPVRSLGSVRWFRDSKDVLAAEHDESSPDYHRFVAGESSDTPYFRSAEDGIPTSFTIGDDDMVVVYGVNHAAVGVALYSNFVVYGEWVLYPCPPPGTPEADRCPTETAPLRFLNGCGHPIWNGVTSMNSHHFTGSAEEYIPGDPVAPYLYAVRVVRASRAAGKDRYRVVVPEPSPSPFVPGELSADGIPLDRPAMIGYRAYVNPATGSGPRHEDLIPDRAIVFRLR